MLRYLLPPIFLLLMFPITTSAATPARFWQVQSIDTMKYSRDLSGQVKNDPKFDAVIDAQIKQIAATGATHMAIGTPYDDTFLPVLHRWVASARKYHLNVWFRGNFAGWEKWFGFSRIDRPTHLKLTESFVLNNKDLFIDGDIFTSCPECENGGPGDPRQTGDVAGHRQFLKDEYRVLVKSFSVIGRRVTANYFSMNGDVAKLIMDAATTKDLGGVVVIDHYVATPEKLVADIKSISEKSGGLVVLGEFGAPIPDIHGRLDEFHQAEWIKNALSLLSRTPQLIGINYWVGVGGSTQLWLENGKALQAAAVITSYFSPGQSKITVRNSAGKIIQGEINYLDRGYSTDTRGEILLPQTDSSVQIKVTSAGYREVYLTIGPSATQVSVELEPEHRKFWYNLQLLTYRLKKSILSLFK